MSKMNIEIQAAGDTSYLQTQVESQPVCAEMCRALALNELMEVEGSDGACEIRPILGHNDVCIGHELLVHGTVVKRWVTLRADPSHRGEQR